MKKKQVLGLIILLANISLITMAFQFFSLKNSHFGNYKYIFSSNNLKTKNHHAAKNASTIATVILMDVAAGPVASAAEAFAEAGLFTPVAIFLWRTVPTAEENILKKSGFTDNLNNLD